MDKTMLIRVTNEKVIKLLYELEDLDLIKIIRKNVKQD